ncbi:uncharacterized protein LOC136033930 [Artemia franciscana]|uniref:DUF4789 domain-containing protein n=1 Tax=Artemia franciscana TaxID=6661 RepID=A0AA88LEJ0_ARTSF|nr:hypothetical protein QYM36_002021 [Artemia franciscana]
MTMKFFVIFFLLFINCFSQIVFNDDSNEMMDSNEQQLPKLSRRIERSTEKSRATKKRRRLTPTNEHLTTKASRAYTKEATTINRIVNKRQNCPSSATYFPGLPKCFDYFTQGPCLNGKWVVLNETTNTGSCKPYPSECNAESSKKPEKCAKALYLLQNTTHPCEEEDGKTFAFLETGVVICVCKTGFLYWEKTDSCYTAYQKEPCNDDHFFVVEDGGKYEETRETINTTERNDENSAKISQNQNPTLNKTRNMDEIDNTYFSNIGSRRVSIEHQVANATLTNDDQEKSRNNTTQSEHIPLRQRNMDEIDNSYFSYLGSRKLKISEQGRENGDFSAQPTNSGNKVKSKEGETIITQIKNSKIRKGAGKEVGHDETTIKNIETVESSNERVKKKTELQDQKQELPKIPIRARNMDEIDNLYFSFIGTRKFPVKGLQNKQMDRNTNQNKINNKDTIAEGGYRGTAQDKINTENVSNETKTILSPTMRPSLRNMDEIDNTYLSYIGTYKQSLSNNTLNVTTDTVYDKDIPSIAMNNDYRNKGTYHALRGVCLPNKCRDGFLLIDLEMLGKSTHSNIQVESMVFFDEQGSDANNLVCDTIGSTRFCKQGYVLEIDPINLTPSCLAADLSERAIFDSVGLLQCPEGYRRSPMGSCIKVRRFLG